MTKNNQITATKFAELLGINQQYEAPQKLMEIMLNPVERIKLFDEFKKFDFQEDEDWFHEYFQQAHADKEYAKQVFTPKHVANLMAELIGASPTDNTLDVASGTGGLLIAKWYNERESDENYIPSNHFYVAEELSDQTIPFLIFNLAIRGMNAAVVHGDSISREAKGVFFLQNDEDKLGSYSSVNVMPYDETVEELFSVKFTHKGYYEPHVETVKIPENVSKNFTADIKKQLADLGVF